MKALTAGFHRFSLGALLLAAPLALAGDLGSAASSTAACCQLTTTMANEAVRPLDIPGDERFFMTEGAPPNIHFLMDTSGSMKELPQINRSNHDAFYNKGDTNAADPLHTGCNNSDLLAVQASRSWDPNKVYDRPDLGTGIGSDTGHDNLFLDSKYYAYMYWDDSSNPNVTWHTKEDACKAQYGNWASTDAARYNNCLSCLQTKGFFKKPGVNDYRTSSPDTRRNFIFWGRFLNFNPPKYVTAKVVLKQVIKDMRRVRAGVSQFAWSNSDSSVNGAAMVREQNPSCDQIIKDSSSFDSNRGSYISAVDALQFDTGTPLAKALLNIGQYFSSTNDIYKVKFDFDDYVFKGGYNNGSLTSQGRSWCWGCQVSSVIIITDGEPSGDNVPSITKSRIQALNGGAVTCANVSDCLDDTGSDAMLDDVAKLLATRDLQDASPAQVGDLNTAGRQSMSIYTIGFGIDSKLLANAAKVGEGEYYTANDATALKDAIMSIIRAVQTRATSFSTTAVSSLQVNAASGTLVPRFKPSKNTASPWQGFLYRFSLAPEVLLGCVDGGASDPGDLNKDGDCDDIHIMDKDQKAVIEDDQGNFVRLDDGVTPAKPFWEAGEKLKPANSVPTTQFWKTRRIYTIIDNGSPAGAGTKDNKIDRHDTPVAFIEENAALLQDYLGISNNPNECATLATKLGIASLPPLECTKLVIRYYRGADAINLDSSKRGYDRPFLLHDIFHSSPVSVEPPTPKSFCGFTNQCLDTLYTGSTEHAGNYVDGDGNARDAYDELLARRGDRDKVVLVGSNGGLLHAIHNGVKTGVDPSTNLAVHDAGTGEELWAFVPPDLLPKLRSQMGMHAYFVDGTPMVRDVWLDGVGADAAKDGKKQADEFRTVAVVGTGTGGVHRFALDLTELIRSPSVVSQANHRPPNAKGDFLWMWPQPCDPLATQIGESFSNFTPKPPPIGPIAMADESGPWKVGLAKTKAREQWIVMLNGGYDPYMVRGRGMAIVDVGTGETLWSFFNGDDTGKRPLADKLRYPIAAGAAMMDVGNGLTSASDADLLFDTATIADFGGQVWTVRFWEPGVRENITTGQVKNWFAARSFQVALNAAQESDEVLVRPAFSYISANTVQPETGYLRTFLGSGDRYHLVDYGTQCSLSNPRACAQLGCTVRTSIDIHRDSLLPISHSDSNFVLNRYVNFLPTTASDAGNACKNPKVTVSWVYGNAGACSARTGKLDYGCTGDANTWTCSSTTSDWVDLKISAPPPAPPATSPNRYYGFWSYGVDPSRRFNTAAEALAFDGKRMFDKDLADVSQFDSATGAVNASVDASSSLGKGWRVGYVPGAERTGSGSTIIDGCVIWSSFEPSGSASAVCSTTGTNKARTYQASFVSGKADCAAGFNINNTTLRYIASSTVAAPPEPAPQRTLINGKVYTSAVVPAVGGGGASGNQQFIVSENKEVLQSVYQLEMDQTTHECRHGGSGVGCK